MILIAVKNGLGIMAGNIGNALYMPPHVLKRFGPDMVRSLVLDVVQ